MKILTDFAKNSMHYRQVKRVKNLAIFLASVETGGAAVAYDVIVIRERGETKVFNNILPPAEYGPSNEDGGSFLWSYPNLQMAEKKFDELVLSGRFDKKDKSL